MVFLFLPPPFFRLVIHVDGLEWFRVLLDSIRRVWSQRVAEK